MTTKECKQFTKGFFEAFNLEAKRLKNMTAIEQLNLKEGNLKPEIVRELWAERVRNSGELRNFLHMVFRLAQLEPELFPEFADSMKVWQDADSFIMKTHIEIEKACEPD